MNATAKLEISVLAAAFTLGVLGDALLRCFPWGVNFALWAGLLAAAIFFLGRARRQAFAEGGVVASAADRALPPGLPLARIAGL